MKGENKKSWEFHGFSSNPQKSYEAGRKGSVLATQASLKEAENPNASNTGNTNSGSSSQNKGNKQGQSWQNPRGGSDKNDKNKSASEE